MRRRPRFEVWLLSLCVLVGSGCTCGGSPPRPPGPPPPSFRTQIAPVLEQSCASARGCHGASPVDWIDMDLRAGTAYAALVNVAAESRDNAVRVKPFDPAQSYLVDKLHGALHAREGKQMPMNPATNRFDPQMLPADFVEKTLTPWIAGGAPNN